MDEQRDDQAAGQGFLAFLRRKKPLVAAALAFGICLSVFSCIRHQMERAAARSDAVKVTTQHQHNPWARDN